MSKRDEWGENPIKDFRNMPFIGRVFFWASFDKALGSEKSYGKLLWENTKIQLGLYVKVAVILIGCVAFGVLFKYLVNALLMVSGHGNLVD